MNSSEANLKNDHLSYELLASYVLFFEGFSANESKFVLEHLKACSKCRSILFEVLNYELSESKPLTFNTWLTPKPGTIVVTTPHGIFSCQQDNNGTLQTIQVSGTTRNWCVIRFNFASKSTFSAINPAGECFIEEKFPDTTDLKSIEVRFSKEKINVVHHKAHHFSWLTYAIAASLLVGIAVAGYITVFDRPASILTEQTQNQQGPDSNQSAEKADTAKPLFQMKKFRESNALTALSKSENFIPHTALEALAEMKYRTGSQKYTISPKNEDSVTVPLTLKFNNAQRYSDFKIFDNKGSLVFDQKNIDQEFTVNALQPGLYYWQVLQNNTLILTHKLIVKE